MITDLNNKKIKSFLNKHTKNCELHCVSLNKEYYMVGFRYMFFKVKKNNKEIQEYLKQSKQDVVFNNANAIKNIKEVSKNKIKDIKISPVSYNNGTDDFLIIVDSDNKMYAFNKLFFEIFNKQCTIKHLSRNGEAAIMQNSVGTNVGLILGVKFVEKDIKTTIMENLNYETI